ncbi:nuclear transport factor 2 family protein [Nereida sp. MMG025]|uniref:nuclear transport factor 2 family protein n=1 Tax=Nereida sp. MMG025 TaxID=2909981 RepID=UPI001F336806|nr:nuclear transport factor 2 family protein [Nereida sp. MMG025]MCF6446039.1 nuclear transport factor 2 family protein [Nereida sp. MMG025]
MPQLPTSLEDRIQQIEDRNYIHEMTSRFADAANRVDAPAFLDLWTQDALWQIGPPIDKQFLGHHEIESAFLGLLCNAWEFFIQMPSAHVIEIEGDEATSRSFVNEIARAKEGTANYNLAVYEDELVRVGSGWKFAKRNYKVLYLDTAPLTGTAYQRKVLT